MKNINRIAVKVSRVIESCFTSEQLNVAQNMLDLFSSKIPNQKVYMRFGSYYTYNGETVKALRSQLDLKRFAINEATRILKGQSICQISQTI